MHILSKQFGGRADLATYCRYFEWRPGQRWHHGKLVDWMLCEGCADRTRCAKNPAGRGREERARQRQSEVSAGLLERRRMFREGLTLSEGRKNLMTREMAERVLSRREAEQDGLVEEAPGEADPEDAEAEEELQLQQAGR
jgi:hypothetical protein